MYISGMWKHISPHMFLEVPNSPSRLKIHSWGKSTFAGKSGCITDCCRFQWTNDTRIIWLLLNKHNPKSVLGIFKHGMYATFHPPATTMSWSVAQQGYDWHIVCLSFAYPPPTVSSVSSSITAVLAVLKGTAFTMKATKSSSFKQLTINARKYFWIGQQPLWKALAIQSSCLSAVASAAPYMLWDACCHFQ